MCFIAFCISVFLVSCGTAPVLKENSNNLPKKNDKAISSENAAVSDKTEEKSSEPVAPGSYAGKHIKLTLEDSGWDIFAPRSSLMQDYRYGPSLMSDGNGGIDAYFSSPGDTTHEFDWFTYRHSDDGGESWGDEKIVLTPTPNSADALSVCDPDVFYYDGYYYLGYTSTIDETRNGLCNSAFIARSENPDGPFLKWNGKGWGGMPKPLIAYDGVNLAWGEGEPSFVVVGDVLYIYSTHDSYTHTLERMKATEVRTADLTDPMWPSRLSVEGIAVDRTDSTGDDEYTFYDCDSLDVAYVEACEKFLAVCVNRRFQNSSCLLYFESDDGVNFERVSEINTNVICGAHNVGIISDANGHIKPSDQVLIGYAYSGSSSTAWGIWSTRLVRAKLEYTDEIDRSDEQADNIRQAISYFGMESHCKIGVSATYVTGYENIGETFDLGYYYLDNNYNTAAINKKDIAYTDYDENIISIGKDGSVIAKNPGMTIANIHYEGFTRPVCFCVLGESVSSGDLNTFRLSGLNMFMDELVISGDDPYAVAIRPTATFTNYVMRELSPEDMEKLGIKISVDDESICTVGDLNILKPIKEGETTVHLTAPGGIECATKVIVK